MTFALPRQKGPASTWDNFRSERIKKRKRGSSLNKRIPHKPQLSNWGRTLAELTSELFLAGVVGYLLFAGWNFLISTPRFQIQNISFKGNNILSDAQILEWLGPVKGKNLIAIDLVELSQRLSENPWIQSASIRRDFPQGIEFKLTERVPYARIKKEEIYLVDSFGATLSPEKPEYKHLPLIIMQGEKENNFLEGKVLHSLKTMHYFNKLSFFDNNPLDTAELIGHFRVLFITQNRDIQIQMSMDRLDEGRKNFLLILDTIEEDNPKIQMIDLSFKDQVVIRNRFKPSSTLIAAKSQTN
ncbi:MAG TPA: FtsQ-type POTRA domain-containing protein [Nitrospinae bacterium]|nr:FtsQ-type POTRA domain-containing protein [Nitrospinota bacterium]